MDHVFYFLEKKMNRFEDIHLPKEGSETTSEVNEVLRENMGEREVEPVKMEAKALEKEPVSKLKKAFLILTSILVLASGVEAYAQQKAEYFSGSQSEISATTITFEKVERSGEFRKALVEQGIRAEEAKELIDFVNAKGVPIEDLEMTVRNMGEKSDKLMLLKTYSIAYEAVKFNYLDSAHEEAFEKWILTSLKNGDLNVAKKPQKSSIGATYNSKSNTYSDDGIILSDLMDKSMTIHELVHAYQDGAELSEKREVSEQEAYMVQGEYVLRQSGMIGQDTAGNYRIAEIELDKIENIHQKIVIVEKALHNTLSNRGDLNKGLSVGGIKMSEVSDTDAVNFLESVKKDLSEYSKSVLKISSGLANMDSGGAIGMDNLIQKDGLKKQIN